MNACAIAIWRRLPRSPGLVQATYIGQVTMKPPTRKAAHAGTALAAARDVARPVQHDQDHRQPFGGQDPEEQAIGALVDLAQRAVVDLPRATIGLGGLITGEGRRQRRVQVGLPGGSERRAAAAAASCRRACPALAGALRNAGRRAAAAGRSSSPWRRCPRPRCVPPCASTAVRQKTRPSPWLLRGSLTLRSSTRTYFSKMRVR